MVRKLSISPEESDLSLPTGDEEKEVKEADFLSSSHPTWSSRMKCLEAYVCAVMSFVITLEHCKTIELYGSAAVVAYVVFAIGVVVPIVLLQIMMGRYVMGSITKVWSMIPIAKGLLACLFGTTAYTIYSNNMCNIYLFKYLFSFYHGYIPWDSCRSPWAKENCFVLGDNSTDFAKCVHAHSESYCRNLNWETSGMQYWKYMAGNHENINAICLSAVFLALSIALVVLINLRGFRSSEKAFVVLVYFPFIIAFVLTFAAYSSPEALSGIITFLKFKWHFIFDWTMWLTVFEDFLLSTGLGTLALSYVSSHGRFKDNIVLDVLVVIFTSVFSSLLTALPILSVAAVARHSHIGSGFAEAFCDHFRQDKVLLFVRLSDAFLRFPAPNVLWSFLFFLEMILISLANQTIMMLAVCEVIWSIFPEKKKFIYCSIIVGIVSFALATPCLFIEFNFEVPIHTSITAIILLFAITWQVFYGFRKLNDDYHFMLGYPPSFFFLRLFWIGIIPVCSGILALKMYFRIPSLPLSYIVFIYAAIPVVLYSAVAVVQIIRAARQGNIRSAFVADPNWKPENPVLKLSRVIFDTRTITKEFIYRQELHRKPLLKPPDFSQQNIIQLT